MFEMDIVLNDFKELRKVMIIAEAGSNWKCGTFEEDLTQGKKLIDAAVAAGADAVKFQTYKPETIYAQDAGKSDYLTKHGIEENINDIFEHLSMPYEMIPDLERYSKEKNIMFMSTPFSIQDADAVDPFVKIHKIASFEINHIRLLEHIFKSRKPVLISTGASTYDEIDFAVDMAKKNNVSIGLLQCTSKYPCSIDALNLGVIPKLYEKYQVPVGLSDHSLDPVIGPVVAVSLGAKFIEKHFTLDRKLPGPDHPFALEPNELKTMVDAIRQAEKAIGSSKKTILEEEKELRQFAKRAIQAIRDIKKGETFQEGVNFEVLRPGNRIKGLDPRDLEKINGRTAKSDIKAGDGITEYA